VSLTYGDNRGRGAYYDLAIAEGSCPPNLPKLQVLDETKPTTGSAIDFKNMRFASGMSALSRLPISGLVACMKA